MQHKRLVIDANILIRAVLGARVRTLIARHADSVAFYIAETNVNAVAAAILLDCPIWTEDQDFFGSGLATWTTATVELYLTAP